jgi:hypothetical protein
MLINHTDGKGERPTAPRCSFCPQSRVFVFRLANTLKRRGFLAHPSTSGVARAPDVDIGDRSKQLSRESLSLCPGFEWKEFPASFSSMNLGSKPLKSYCILCNRSVVAPGPTSDASPGDSLGLLVMTEFAGCFLCVKKVSSYRGSMSVVAHATALEHPRIVSVDFGKIVALMAIETATFEREESAPA